MYTTTYKIRTEKLIQYIIFIYAIVSIFLIGVEFWNYTPGRRMSISYYMLPLFISIIVQFFFFNKKEDIKHRIIRYVLYFILFYKYIYFYMIFASRGALVSIIISIFICFIASRKRHISKIIYTVVGILISLVLVFYMENILNTTNSVLNAFNIYSRTLERTIELVDNENMGNGRNTLYSDVWNEILSSPMLGNGIGKFYDTYLTYPHNIILQAWHEGGILYMLLLVAPIIYSVYSILFDKSILNRDKSLLILLFSISIIRLTISYEYWKDNYFWLYLYMCFLIIVGRSKFNGNSNNSNIQKNG